jgi:chromate reductase
MSQPEVFIQATDDLFLPDGSIGPDTRDFLKGWMDRFVAWVQKHAA